MLKNSVNDNYLKHLNDMDFILFILIKENFENSNNDEKLVNLIDWLSILLDQLISQCIIHRISRNCIEGTLNEIATFIQFLQEKLLSIETMNSLSSKLNLISSKIVKHYTQDTTKDLLIEHLKI